MLGVGDFMRAAKGGPNMASKIPAAEGAKTAMHTALGGGSTGGGIRAGSMEGLNVGNSAVVSPIGGAYEAFSSGRSGKEMFMQIPKPTFKTPRPTPSIDSRSLSYNGVTLDSQLSKLV